MSKSINEQMGLPHRAGTRAMMKLPKDRATRVRITAAVCPTCGERGARPKPRQPGFVFCAFCYHTWELPDESETIG
jgi:hypothetical protein